MSKNRSFSSNPANAEQGGGLGFPDGALVTLQECKAGKWEEAGEKALKGGRDADDPALILVGDVEDKEEAITVFLSAGKHTRIQPSDDGEYFEPAEGSTAKGLNDSCNATLFLASLTDKKRQGKMVMDGELIDEGFSQLAGLQFRAGYEVLKRDLPDDGEEGKKKGPRPHLIAAEIVKLPGKGKSSTSTSTKKKKDDDEEEEPAPKKGKGKKPAGAEEVAEQAIVAALALPKYRKGIAMNRVFSAVFNTSEVKESDEKDDILAFAKDEDWVKDDARPWKYDSDEDQIQAVD